MTSTKISDVDTTFDTRSLRKMTQLLPFHAFKFFSVIMQFSQVIYTLHSKGALHLPDLPEFHTVQYLDGHLFSMAGHLLLS